MMQLWMMDAEELEHPQKFACALKLVSEERRNKVNRILNEEKRRLSLAAGLLLKQAFYEADQEHLYYEISYTELGKPYLPGNEFYFSLSHSGKIALCGVSHQPMGCDIELKRERLPRIANVFSAKESSEFSLLDEAEKINFFFQLWTCKESIVKWMGKGITVPFKTLSVMEGGTPPKALLLDNKMLYLKQYFI